MKFKTSMLAFMILLITISLQGAFAMQAPTLALAGEQAEQTSELAVMFSGFEILKISTQVTEPLDPAERAGLIVENILAFAESRTHVDALHIKPLNESYGITHRDHILLMVTDKDAENAHSSKSALANHVLKKIKQAVDHYREQHRLKIYGLGAAYTLLSLIAMWLILHFNHKAFLWLSNKTHKIDGFWKSGLTFKGVEFISPHKIIQLTLSALKVLRLILILIVLDIFLPITLSFFPETNQLGEQIFTYAVNPFKTILSSFLALIPNLFYIAVIGILAFYTLRVFAFIFGLIEKGELKLDWFYDDWAKPTYQITRFLVIVTALICAYPYIPGSSSNAFQGIGLVLGAIISFASSSAISNIVAGIILTYTRAFKLQDRIQVGEAVGDVVEKTLLVTRIRTIKHIVVTIPNAVVMGSQIVNYSTSASEGGGIILHTTVTIGYDVPWQTVEQLLLNAAAETKLIMKTPTPFVLQTSLDDWYVSYEINAYTKHPKQMALIYSDLHRHIQNQFDAANVEIMSPHYLSLRDGNATTIPSQLNQEHYRAPAFQFNQSK